MNIREIRNQLAQYDQNLHVVLRDSPSGLIHVLLCLVEDTVALNAYQDLRCGPHNLTYRPFEKESPILHFGQQSWHGNYPDTPDVETVGKLTAELARRDQDKPAVITHHFDEFIDVDIIEILGNTNSPMLWGNPGSGLRSWPTGINNKLPTRVLLIGNSENEAYSHLRRPMNRELDAGVFLLHTHRQGYQGKDPLPRAGGDVSRTSLQEDHRRAVEETSAAWKRLEGAVRKATSATDSPPHIKHPEIRVTTMDEDMRLVPTKGRHSEELFEGPIIRRLCICR